MLKKALIITIAMISMAGFQSQAIAEVAVAAPNQTPITVEEAAALEALQAALAAATTPEQKSQILADAIAANPTLASKPQLRALATSAGMSLAQYDNAVIRGTVQAREEIRSAGGTSALDDASILSIPSFSSLGGGLTSAAVQSQASNGG